MTDYSHTNYNSSVLANHCRLVGVPRWVIVPMIRPQSVAEHSWRVMAITRFLVAELDLTQDSVAAMSILRLAMVHDVDEAHTGDIPTTFKHKFGAQVSPPPNPFIKLADLIEAFCYLTQYGVKSRRWAHIKRGLQDRMDLAIGALAAHLGTDGPTGDVNSRIKSAADRAIDTLLEEV